MFKFGVKKTDEDMQIALDVRAEMIPEQAMQNLIEDPRPQPTVLPEDKVPPKSKRKVSQLVDENFPFDESQIAAIDGMVKSQYACLTGAAGTGKTTTSKKLVDTLMNQGGTQWVDMAAYFKRGTDDSAMGDPDDDYEIPEDYIPSVVLVSFTGKASQQIKKNFPRDWHGNIMTIHRCLAYVPERYEDFDENGEVKYKMRFVPTYTADNKLPWDIIIMDESGMTGLDLWHNLWAACKPGCRIYMIGDINQLPPVHGKSIFGFALAKWPSFELTHIHRQQGKDNAIVDNAWRVLKGQLPKSEANFQMIELKGDAATASRYVKGILYNLKDVKGVYDPMRDTVITPINGHDGATGQVLGQIPLNNDLALKFNPANANPRYIIDGGRERKMFAVGDKVMATKNDHRQGITNGMQGIIVDIVRNADYRGDPNRFGTVEEVNAHMEGLNAEHEDDGIVLSLDDVHEDFLTLEEAQQADKKREEQGRGPASHTVRVRFGTEEHGFELDFTSLSEVESLSMSYVVTCHKMQGGEAPVIIIICHDAHKKMLYREWLYTAITRASQLCILLYSPTALRTALSKQNISGSTLQQKIAAFNKWMDGGKLGVGMKVDLPEAKEGPTTLTGKTDIAEDNREEEAIVAREGAERPEPQDSSNLPAIIQQPATPIVHEQPTTPTRITSKLQDLLAKSKERMGVEPRVEREVEVRYVIVEPVRDDSVWDHGAQDITPEKVESDAEFYDRLDAEDRKYMLDTLMLEGPKPLNRFNWYVDNESTGEDWNVMIADRDWLDEFRAKWESMTGQNYNPQLLLTHTPPAQPMTPMEKFKAMIAAKAEARKVGV